MKRFVLCIVLIGLTSATAIYCKDAMTRAQVIQTVIDNKGPRGDVLFLRKYMQVMDGYTTVTVAQKYASVGRIADALTTSGEMLVELAQLTPTEIATARVVVKEFIADWRAAQQGQIDAAANDWVSEIEE